VKAPCSLLRLACATFAFGWIAVTPAAGQPTPSPGDSSAAAHDLLVGFAREWAGVGAYTATVTVFERKDAQVQNMVLNYSFRKPASATALVTAGAMTGSVLAWDGGTTVVVKLRGSGFLSLFKRRLSLHDPMATTIRGSSIDELSFPAILAHAQQEAGTLSTTPEVVIDGVAVDAVTLMPATVDAGAGLTREVVELSPATHLPMRVLGYDGQTLVLSLEFTNVAVEGASAVAKR
jgi:hypothetical protein